MSTYWKVHKKEDSSNGLLDKFCQALPPNHHLLLYLPQCNFAKLFELEKSDAPFNDTVTPYFELLQRGIGRLFVTEHCKTLDIQLGHSNAQCMCFECVKQAPQLNEVIDNTTSSPQLFSL